MKRLKALFLFAFAAGIAVIGIIPGCDELVTSENYDTTFITETINDSACVAACHSDENFTMEFAIRQWQNSGHNNVDYTGDTLLGLSAASCGPECHTMNEFINSLDGSASATEYPLEIRCKSCHAVHTTWDFSLRDTSAVVLDNGEVFNYGAGGNSNICARCHRSTYNVINVVAVGMQIDSNWVRQIIHGGQDAEMIIGKGGYEYTGETYTSTHANVIQGCIGCHQESDLGFDLGGHSLNIRDGNGGDIADATCNKSGCHDGNPYGDASIAAKQNLYYNSLLNGLRTKLVSAGLLDDATSLPPEGLLPITSLDSVGALYNYLFLKADKSRGMHNYNYSLQLLSTSTAFLDNPPE